MNQLPPTDPDSPWYRNVPVTPIMDHQLDEAVLSILLIPLNTKIAHHLKTNFEDHKTAKKNWFNIFLALVILISNIEHQIRHDNRFAKRYGLEVRY
jgi:hypothetical protein